MRKAIIDASEELRHLEKKLQSGYVCKEQLVQMKEREADAVRRKARRLSDIFDLIAHVVARN